jgi:hypothetical protein
MDLDEMKTVYIPIPPMKKSSLVYSLVVLAISMVQAFAITITPKTNTITFSSPKGTNNYTSSLPLTASATDGGTITFTGNNAVGSVSGNTFTPTGVAGSISIVATELNPVAGYKTPVAVTNVITIKQLTNSISFAAPANASSANSASGPISLSATASDGGTVSFSTTNSSVASISGNILTLKGPAGNVNIVASEVSPATGYIVAKSVTNTITITQNSNSITFSSPSSGAISYTASPITLNATATDGGNITFSTTASNSVGSISGNTLTLGGAAGTISIVASEASPVAGYAAARSVTNTLTISKLTNSISFTEPANASSANSGSGPISLSATASDGGTVSFSTTNSSVASISGNILTLKGPAGNVNIVASEVSPATGYIVAKSVTNTITITQNSNSITFSSPSSGAISYTASPITLNATATDGGNITFSTTASNSVGSISGNTLTLGGAAGTISIVASEASPVAGYAAARSVTNTLTVRQLSNSITWSSPSSGATVSRTTPVSLSASATDNGSIFYSIATADLAKGTLSGSTLTLTTNSTGTIHLVASEATAATGYAKAVAVTNVVTISTNGAITPTISPVTIGSQTYSTNATVTVSPTSTSPGAITLSVSGPATNSGTTVTLTGAGIVTVFATQSASGNYTAVTSPVQVASFTVNKGSQTITFPSLSYPGSITLGSSISVPQPTSSSGLSVSLSATGAAYANNQLTINAGGTVTITATQAGNVNFNAASAVSHSFSVNSKGGGEYSFSPLN